MLVKVLKKEKAEGTRLEPGTILELPDSQAAELAAKGIVVILSRQKMTNLAVGALPAGAHILVKHPTG